MIFNFSPYVLVFGVVTLEPNKNLKVNIVLLYIWRFEKYSILIRLKRQGNVNIKHTKKTQYFS